MVCECHVFNRETTSLDYIFACGSINIPNQLIYEGLTHAIASEIRMRAGCVSLAVYGRQSAGFMELGLKELF